MKSNVNKVVEPNIFGLYFFKLDKVGKKDSYMLVYGNKRNVNLFKEQFNIKGEYKEYVRKGWLVKRIEALKYKYKDDITIRCVDGDYKG